MTPMFLLSHHHPEEYGRCYRFGPLIICARCLGTYPVLLAALLFQFSTRPRLSYPDDVLMAVVLVAPATLDWAFGRFKPAAGSNAWRTFTGVLLGLGLGRSLFVHFQRPFPPMLIAQASLVTMVGVPVILAAYWRLRHR